MPLTEFRYHDGTVDSDDRTLAEPLTKVLRQGLRIDRIPGALPLVGHCKVGDRWCVFCREPGEHAIRGVVLSSNAYLQLDFNPFVTAAKHLGGSSVKRAAREGPVDPPSSRNAGDADEPLRAAYGAFLTGDRWRRQGPYLSVLPIGLAPQISPLTYLVAAPPGGDIDSGLDTTADLPLRRRSPAPDADAWDAVPLDHGVGQAAPPPPEEPAPAQPTTGVDELVTRVRDLERRLAATRRAVVAAIVVLLVGVGAGGLLLERRIARLSASTLPLTAVADALGVEAPAEEVVDAVAAHLRDMSTVAVQSGAWQAVLERRGVERDVFLDRLVDLSARRKELLELAGDARPLAALARSAAPLADLAPRAAELVALASVREPLEQVAAEAGPLGAVAGRSEALVSLADAGPSLLGLASESEALGRVASGAADLAALAAQREGLVALADRRFPLEALAASATPLQTLVVHGADLIVFWERHGTAIETLAQQQSSLSALVERQRSLARLVEESPALYAVAGSEPLQRLVARPDQLRDLDRELDRVLLLARHADAVLAPLGVTP